MLRYLYADQLKNHPPLADEMFTHRADQFRTRLGWDVNVDARGHERDEYDALNPLYVIWETPEGGHGGSTRFLPTTGPVMINDHFDHLIDAPITSPLIWECTRFCMAPGQGAHVAAALMLGGGELMNGFGVRHFVGVFSVGLWAFEADAQMRVAERAGISPALSQSWFNRAFGTEPVAVFAQTG
jgi:N-acyl-L-homoserine lactone synthetase